MIYRDIFKVNKLWNAVKDEQKHQPLTVEIPQDAWISNYLKKEHIFDSV